jgi:hypothetical protein
MKVIITHLKAPWPAGARLGDVVEVGDVVPACLLGKCAETATKADAAHTYVPARPADAGGAPEMEAMRAENAALRAMLEAKPTEEPTLTRGRGR